MIRRTILTGLIVGVCGIMTYVFADEPPKQEKEKSELAKLMSSIDKSYKAVEEISGYYKYSDNDWKVIAESSANIATLSSSRLAIFARNAVKRPRPYSSLAARARYIPTPPFTTPRKGTSSKLPILLRWSSWKKARW